MAIISLPRRFDLGPASVPLFAFFCGVTQVGEAVSASNKARQLVRKRMEILQGLP